MATQRHPALAQRDDSALFIVDVQERFRAHIHGFEALAAAIDLLIGGARELGLPIGLSEQYPQGLGATVAEIETALEGDDTWRFEKLEVSSHAAEGWGAAPARFAQRRTLIVCGIEAHVCVSQTVHDLVHAGYSVHVPADAVGSRDAWQREMALERMARSGAHVTTVETVLFELLGVAGTPEFGAVQRLIKAHDAARAARETEVLA